MTRSITIIALVLSATTALAGPGDYREGRVSDGYDRGPRVHGEVDAWDYDDSAYDDDRYEPGDEMDSSIEACQSANAALQVAKAATIAALGRWMQCMDSQPESLDLASATDSCSEQRSELDEADAAEQAARANMLEKCGY